MPRVNQSASAVLTIAIASIVAWLVVVGGAIYIVLHFIKKLW